MPNYVTNKVSINSDKETINKIKKDYFERKNDKGETLPFSFQFIKQRPESLDIEEGSKTNLGIEYVNGTEEEKKSVIQRVKAFEMKLDEVIKLGEQAVENKKTYQVFYYSIGLTYIELKFILHLPHHHNPNPKVLLQNLHLD